jgi:hypothetical protein
MRAGVVFPRFLLLALPAALAMLLFHLGAEPTQAQERVSISGLLVNGTPGAGLVTPLPVTLHAFAAGERPVITTSTTADAAGRFRFEEVVLGEGWSYVVSVAYAGAVYSVALAVGDLANPVELKVYETTQDAGVVEVTQHVLVVVHVDAKRGQIGAIEFVQLRNTGQRTLVPDLAKPDRVSFLRFSLPPQATELDVQSDLPVGQIVSIGTGFAITAPVLPGEHSLSFSYRFPYRGDGVSYRQSFLQGARLYQVLVPEALRQVGVVPPINTELSALQPRQVGVDLNGALYRVWEARSVNPGQGLVLELRNLPRPSLLDRIEKSVSEGSFWKVSIPGFLGAALAVLLLYGALHRESR